MGKKKSKEAQKAPKEESPYKVSWLDRIPYWIKALFIKWWFFGVIYFFFVMGLSAIIGNENFTAVIQIIIIGFAFGVITDLMTNNVLEMVESNKRESRYWAMWAGHKYYIFIVNVVYGFALGVATSLVCAQFTTLIDNATGSVNYWFREPCTFALVALAIDMACIGIKDLIVYLIVGRKAPKEKEGGLIE